MARSKKKTESAESLTPGKHPGELSANVDFSKPWTLDRSAYDKVAFAELVMKLKTSTSKLEYHPDGTVTFHWYEMGKPSESQSFSKALENL